MEHQETPPPTNDAAVAIVLARAEQAVAETAERLLVERLHRMLDEQGSAAMSSLSETLLPLLQSLVIVLPRALTDGTSPAVLTAARTLGASMRQHGVPLSALLSEGAAVHDRLLQAVASEVRATDLAVVAAMLRISHALLDVERAIVLAYQQETEEPAPVPHDDPASGLMAWAHVTEWLSRDAGPAHGPTRPLALVVMALDGADVAQARAFASLLRRHTRVVDTASRSPDGLYVLVMPRTERAGASRVLDRLQLAAASALPALRLTGVAVAAPEDEQEGAALLDRARRALEALRGPKP